MGLSLSLSFRQWQAMGKREWSVGTMSMSFFRRSSSRTGMIFSPVGDEGSSMTILASAGAGNVRVMIWMISTPAENVSSLSE